MAENDLIIPSNNEEWPTVENNKDEECPTVENNLESLKTTTISSIETCNNDNIIDTGVEKVQVIEDKLEDLNKNLDKKLDKVSKLTKLLFVSHFI